MNRHLFFALLFLQLCFYSCKFGEGYDTPKEYLNIVKVDKEVYANDKVAVNKQLEQFLSAHEQSFYSKEYFDSTIIEIDTILYSEDKNRIAVFAFTKNPTSRQRDPVKKEKWYYDAYCYLGKRQSDTFDLRWLSRFNVINFYNQHSAKSRLREMYFKEFAAWKNTDDSYRYGVNLDDKRFWTCFVWKEYYEQ